jgi:hypothetical protein
MDCPFGPGQIPGPISPYKRGVTGSNPVAPTRFLQLDGHFETLIGGPVTTAGNHRCMLPDGGVPKGPWQHPLRPPGRAAPTPACCTTCSTRHRGSVPATGGWRLRAAVGAVICASRRAGSASDRERDEEDADPVPRGPRIRRGSYPMRPPRPAGRAAACAHRGRPACSWPRLPLPPGRRH